MNSNSDKLRMMDIVKYIRTVNQFAETDSLAVEH